MGALSTFSIVATDPKAEELGMAAQSKFIAMGVVAPWARAGVGASVTQSCANTSYGPQGLNLLSQGPFARRGFGKVNFRRP